MVERAFLEDIRDLFDKTWGVNPATRTLRSVCQDKGFACYVVMADTDGYICKVCGWVYR